LNAITLFDDVPVIRFSQAVAFKASFRLMPESMNARVSSGSRPAPGVTRGGRIRKRKGFGFVDDVVWPLRFFRSVVALVIKENHISLFKNVSRRFPLTSVLPGRLSVDAVANRGG